MNYITVRLTEDQARGVIQALEWAQNEDYPASDKGNAFYQRIINKIWNTIHASYGPKS